MVPTNMGRFVGQPRSYMRSELEELLGLKDKTKLGDAESQPLLLSVVESYLKAEVSMQCERFPKGLILSCIFNGFATTYGGRD
jgi:hypothetical protein